MTPPLQLPKRILLTADAVGGVWTYALELSRALAAGDIEIALAVLGGGVSEAQRAQAAAVPGVRLFEHPGRLEWMNDPWEDVARAGSWLLALAKEFQPDLAHLNGYTHGALPWPCPVLVVGHSCVCSWWRAVHGADAPAGWTDYRRAVTKGLRRAGMVVAPSRAMLDALGEHYGPISNGRVIPNGLTIDGAICRERREFIFAAGRVWDEAKNLSTLASAAAGLNWPVYIAGDPTGPAGSGAAANTGAAAANVFHLGRLERPELQAWYERASIYALPARYEPFGLSVLEAALAGCALVLGDIPSLRETWADAARYVPPGDAAALHDLLRTLIRNRRDIARLAARSVRVARRHSAEAMAARYLAAYSDLLGDRTHAFSALTDSSPREHAFAAQLTGRP